MTGFVIRQDYRVGTDPAWSYLQQTPYNQSWGWTGGSDTATVLAPHVAQAIAKYLLVAGLDVRVLPDLQHRSPSVVDVPQQFKAVA